jgi:hypothetical protein
VEFFGHRIPADVTPQIAGEPMPACRDTLYAGYIELASGSNAARALHQYVRNCEGPRRLENDERTGTYTMNADTVHFTWRIDSDLISTITERAILVGEQLRNPYTVYSEENPDGEQTTYIIYQR